MKITYKIKKTKITFKVLSNVDTKNFNQMESLKLLISEDRQKVFNNLRDYEVLLLNVRHEHIKVLINHEISKYKVQIDNFNRAIRAVNNELDKLHNE